VVRQNLEAGGPGDVVEDLVLLGGLDGLDVVLVVLDQLVDYVVLEEVDVLLVGQVAGVVEGCRRRRRGFVWFVGSLAVPATRMSRGATSPTSARTTGISWSSSVPESASSDPSVSAFTTRPSSSVETAISASSASTASITSSTSWSRTTRTWRAGHRRIEVRCGDLHAVGGGDLLDALELLFGPDLGERFGL